MGGERRRDYVEGWRDQYCPICGAGPFVVATTHVTMVHGKQKLSLASEDFRLGKRAHAEDRDVASLWRAPPDRYQRWAATYHDERAKGGLIGLKVRLARRWRVSHKAAGRRIVRLRQLGLVSERQMLAPPRPRYTHCSKGHPFDEANTHVDSNGWRNCRRCSAERRLRNRNRRRKRGQWATNHPWCVECGRVKYPHYAKGLCRQCYNRAYHATHKRAS